PGRISERLVDSANSVIADQTVLTRIVSVDPIHFAFEGSEALLLKYERANSAAPGSPVRVKLQDEDAYRHTGRIDFIDPVINPGSGTAKGRAVIRNADGFRSEEHTSELQS